MNDPIAKHFIDKYCAVIKDTFQPSELWLWGSRIYGTPKADSDLDCVVVSDKFAPMRFIRRSIEFQKIIGKTKDSFAFSLNSFCFTPEEFARKKADPWMMKDLFQKGLRLI
jgi:predicted nucleotidyltransferase